MSNIKIAINCPHCKEQHIIEGEEYRDVLYGKYFDEGVVLDFETDIKERIKNKTMMPYMAIMAYHNTPCDCMHCGKRIKIVHDYNQYFINDNENDYSYFVKKSGQNLDKLHINKLFKKLSNKGRGVGKAKKGDEFIQTSYNKCEREVFVDKWWNIYCKKELTQRPYIIRFKNEMFIGYIGNISFSLGWTDGITIHMIDIYGSLRSFICEQSDLYDLEFNEFPLELANDVLEQIGEMR